MPPLSIAAGSKMKMDVPNKLIIFIRNKQVSRKKKKKHIRKTRSFVISFTKTNNASIKLPLSYISEKADHDPVCMKDFFRSYKR